MILTTLALPLQEVAQEFETDWNSTAWTLWLAFTALGIFLAWRGPSLARSGSLLWGAGALASYVFLFFVAYPALARHASGKWPLGLFVIFAIVAVGAWITIWDSLDSRFIANLVGGTLVVLVLYTGAKEALTRNAAQAHMATGDYTGGIIGLIAIIGLFVWAKSRE